MANISVKDLFQAGVHYGHKKRFWNAQMAPYVYGIKNDQHIIDLDKTLVMFLQANEFLKTLIMENKTVLFVGCKKSSRQFIKEEATRIGMPYVDHRWMGGTLTNYSTIYRSIRKLKTLKKKKEEGFFDQLSKREALTNQRALNKLHINLGGIENMKGLPHALFVTDVGHERNAVLEANKLGIPVIGIVDTNNSTSGIDFIIPGNDDSMRSQRLYSQVVADTILEAQADRIINSNQETLTKQKDDDSVVVDLLNQDVKIAKDATPKAVEKTQPKIAEKEEPKKIVKKDVASKEKTQSAEKTEPKVAEKTVQSTEKESALLSKQETVNNEQKS